jgi:hypothetical protein
MLAGKKEARTFCKDYLTSVFLGYNEVGAFAPLKGRHATESF